MKKYNLNHLIKVELEDAEISDSIKVVKEDKKIFGFTYQKKGIYDYNNYPVDLSNSISYFLKDDGAYRKPFVRLWFTDNHKKTKYFDTFEEAKSRYNSYKGVWENAN